MIPSEVSVSGQGDETGRPPATPGVARNIAGGERLDHQLRVAARRYRLLVQVRSDAVRGAGAGR